jgi:plastocyanin
MVFSVNANPDSAKSFAAFQANAEATAPASTATAAPVAASSGAAILVLVGANNQLTFSPSNITANVGDTVTFQFESKNHVREICHPLSLCTNLNSSQSVTQSSFASPCTPLTPGVDSGFVPVTPNAANVPEFSFTISNASNPLFFFSKQTVYAYPCSANLKGLLIHLIQSSQRV